MGWRLCCILVIALSVLSFTPVVIPAGKFDPILFGMPRTLWLGLLISLAYVALALAGALLHPGIRGEAGKIVSPDPWQDESAAL